MGETTQPILYLMIGFPGSGKTTTSEYIHQLTGAVHLCADHERHDLFPNPTHSQAESTELYKILDDRTDTLLSEGKSVIFDTNFNFRSDRDLLRRIAAQNGATSKVIWVQTPREVALQRAQHIDHANTNRYTDTMTEADFIRLTSNLEPPTDDEQPIILNGQSLTITDVATALGLDLQHMNDDIAAASGSEPQSEVSTSGGHTTDEQGTS